MRSLDGMDSLWVALVTTAAVALNLGGLVWLAARARRRGIGGSVLGPLEEIYHPTAHRARVEVQVQDERRTPTPSPGDPPWLDDQGATSHADRYRAPWRC